ncbi:unnamed protein product [marine sediment metagenome]|uniref:Carbohydrate kinase FGGY N-terminal domain-containing protein n=1 Tax=marine sediment metagenome TaxID=412755 RepID=X1CV86_9ZZZZ
MKTSEHSSFHHNIFGPWDIIGHLSKEAANHCALIEGIPIAAGAGDTTTSYLGAGIVKPGIIFDVAGTASVLASCTNEFSPDLKYKTVMCSRSVIQNLFSPRYSFQPNHPKK